MSPLEAAPFGTTDFVTRPLWVSREKAQEVSGSWPSLPGRERVALFERALDGLWLAFQPIVSIGKMDSPPFAFEALARNHEAAVSDPMDLLGLAVAVGRVADLGHVVHTRAADLLRQNHNVTLFVNVDVEELMRPWGEGHDPLTPFAHRVVLEVTERAPISGLPEIRENVTALREQGYRFAMDDLGGGYASLSTLALMDPQFVKVDQALIRDVDVEPVKKKIVGSVVALTRQLGIGCIVEGVETESERDALKALDCDLMQGYLFGRPGPI